MLLYFFITCFSFILFLKPLSRKPLRSWAIEMRLLPLCFRKDLSLSLFSVFGLLRNTLFKGFYISTSNMFIQKIALTTSTSMVAKLEKPVEDAYQGMSILDLPELALECILERLPPSGLCSMAGVCTNLRERCISDHLWEKHMKQKWGKIIGPAAYRVWQCHIASRKDVDSCKRGSSKRLIRLLSAVLPLSWSNRSRVDDDSKQRSSLPVDSIMSWYLALETGKFWFPAQVYNRENGHVGFMLSCYDANLSYDPHTNAFQASYPPHGSRPVSIENVVPWERLRASPISTSPHDLHISDCLSELCPGDHIEIQWRRNKEFPYGWWYGVVGHLESCDGNGNHCQCYNSDTVVLEFHQYTPGSRWRRTIVNRKEHREEGNEADGFYGGIRKLINKEEISRWKEHWPAAVLD